MLGDKDQSFHDTLKRTWQKLKMLIDFYSTLRHKVSYTLLEIATTSSKWSNLCSTFIFGKSHVVKNIYKDVNHYYICQLTWRLVTTFPEENGFWNKTIKNADLLKGESFLC